MGKNRLNIFLLPAALLAMGTLSFGVVRASAIGAVAEVDGISYETMEEAIGAWRRGSTLKLLRDAAGELTVRESKAFDLNGYTLTGGGETSVISVLGEGVAFTLTDSSASRSGKVTGGEAILGGGVSVEGASVSFTGGSVTGNTALAYGGGFYLSGNASLLLSGGKVTNNDAAFGGGVFLETASAEMTSGEVSGNRASLSGGGVYAFGENGASEFTFSGGSISGNTAEESGGGITIWQGAVLNMTEGSVTGNRAVKGGGIYVLGHIDRTNPGRANFSGGTVSGNTAEENGGGVCVGEEGKAVFSGTVSVTGNTDRAAAENPGKGNVFLEEEDLVEVSASFGGELGFAMERSGVIARNYTGSGNGLSADREGCALETDGSLRLTVPEESSSGGSGGGTSGELPGGSGGETDSAPNAGFAVLIAGAALVVIALIAVGYVLDRFKKRKR